MTIDDSRRFYAEEVRIAAGLDSPALVAAYARVPREKFMGPPPWKIASPETISMAFMGLAPFGSLFSGGLAVKMGADNTLLWAGFFCIIAAIIFALHLPRLRDYIRPLYIKKGIIAETIQ